MNPVTRLYRRSRAFRVVLYILLIPAWVLLGFLALGSFRGYTQAGSAGVLVTILLFAAWAWWYGEDRDRRQAARARSGDGTAAEAEAERAPDSRIGL